jgi:hypothetical protein
MLSRHTYLAPLAALMFMAAPAHGQGNSVRQGVLTCQMSASIGLIVGSRQRLRCQFKSNSGWVQNYSGVINRVGLDLGVTAGGVMTWGVLASTSNIQRTALTGRFVGASGDIAIGVGVGANALIGGTQKSISLQPLSVEGQVGVNLALGVAGMTLTPTH